MFTQLKHYKSITPTLVVPTGKPKNKKNLWQFFIPIYLFSLEIVGSVLHTLDRTDRLYQ